MFVKNNVDRCMRMGVPGVDCGRRRRRRCWGGRGARVFRARVAMATLASVARATTRPNSISRRSAPNETRPPPPPLTHTRIHHTLSLAAAIASSTHNTHLLFSNTRIPSEFCLAIAHLNFNKRYARETKRGRAQADRRMRRSGSDVRARE